MFKKYPFTCLLLTCSILSFILYQIAPRFSHLIETYYASYLNHTFIQVLSFFTGLLPFSLLEIGIFLLLLYVIGHIIYRIIHVIKCPHSWKKHFKHWGIHTLNLVSILWLSFSLGWGFNYFRTPLTTSLNLLSSATPKEDLTALYAYLITQVNTLRPLVTEDEQGYMMIEGGFDSVQKRARLGYECLAQTFPIFKGTYGAPKSLLVSPVMNYTGITGIYSPFTGEANVNTAILDQSLPSTTLHEMAHQRGFAKEAECNFIAFLACSVHPDLDFQYSGYLLALAYTSQTLFQVDYEALVTLNGTISESVMKDINHNNIFWRQFEGPVEQVSSSVNHHYLKANGVETGTANYGEMVNLLLEYYVTYLKP